MKHLEKEEDFNKIIKEGKVLVDFYADWCGPCKMLAPILEEVSSENNSITILKVNVDDFPNIAKRFGIMSIPTLKLFESGEDKKTSIGFISKEEIEDFIK